MESIAFIIGFISFIVTVIMLFAEFKHRLDHKENILFFGTWVFFPSTAILVKILKSTDIDNLTLFIDSCLILIFAISFTIYSINPLLNFITALN